MINVRRHGIGAEEVKILDLMPFAVTDVEGENQTLTLTLTQMCLNRKLSATSRLSMPR